MDTADQEGGVMSELTVEQPHARKRFEEWVEGGWLIARWTWEREPT